MAVQKPDADAEVRVPMAHVASFVRQLTHDLRNQLNAADLQSTLLGELANDAELKGEVQRLRGMLSAMGNSLQRLTSSLASTSLTEMPYQARDFVEDLRHKVAAQFPQEKIAIDWEENVGDATLHIDPQVLQQAFLELFANAFQHERSVDCLRATAAVERNEFVFTLREPKEKFAHSTEHWGREPFQKMAHGHYGLGLHRARNIIEEHGGELRAHYDEASASLLTTVTLPVAAQE